MSDVTTAWIRELERRFGVRAEFARCLLPLLEPLVRSCDASERESILHAVAAAYRSTANEGSTDHGTELDLLCGQFLSELRKMDESLKVLSVVLQRVRQQMARSASPDPLH